MLKAEMHKVLRRFRSMPPQDEKVLIVDEGDLEYCVDCARDAWSEISDRINMGEIHNLQIEDYKGFTSDIPHMCSECGDMIVDTDEEDDYDDDDDLDEVEPVVPPWKGEFDLDDD
mgnify:CR=1 FL=1